MYQVEREKLSDKYKQKDESIRSLSTQLQLNKLALLEINKYFQTFIGFSDMDGHSNQDKSSKEEEEEEEENVDNKSKREFIQGQIKQLLTELTNNSTKTLDKVNENESSNSNEINNLQKVINYKSALVNNRQHDDTDSKLEAEQRAASRSVILCNSCEGDLFVV
jgi:hypothetical protein